MVPILYRWADKSARCATESGSVGAVSGGVLTSDQVGEGSQPGYQVRLVNPTDFSEAASYYSNFVQVNISPHEFELYFSRYSMPILMQPPSEPTSVDVTPQPVANIAIPLSLVRALITALETSVQNWETNFGAPLPTEPTLGSAAGTAEAGRQTEVHEQ
jgi:hypothetical protein